jgi:heptosyltransferase-3
MSAARSLDLAQSVRSILVIQTKYIGDVVITAALTEGLRRAYPGARIDMVCDSNLADFVQDNGVADATIPLVRARARGSNLERLSERWRLLRRVARGGHDLSIDLADSSTSQLIQRASRAPVRVSYDPPEKRSALLWFGKPWTHPCPRFGDHGVSYLERYLAPLAVLGHPSDGLVPHLAPTPARMTEARSLLAESGMAPGRFIAVHAGARSLPRRWSPERFAHVLSAAAGRHGLDVALVGGPDERELSDAVAASCRVRTVNLAGRCAIAALPALVSGARLFVGNESGPMHVAAAVGVPVVGLFGLTDPQVWGPATQRAVVLRPPMPCQCLRPDACVRDDTNGAWCVHRISEDEVLAAIERLIRDTSAT